MRVLAIVLAVCLLLACVEAGKKKGERKGGREGGRDRTQNKRPGKVGKGPQAGKPCPDINSPEYKIEWKGKKACCKDGMWNWPTGGPVLIQRPNGIDNAKHIPKRCRGSGVFKVSGPNECGCTREDICPEDGDNAYVNWCCVNNEWRYPNPETNGETYFTRYVHDDAKEIEPRCKGGDRFQILGKHNCRCLPYSPPRQGPNVEQAGALKERITMGKCQNKGDFILLERQFPDGTSYRGIPAVCMDPSDKEGWIVMCWDDMDINFARDLCEGLGGSRDVEVAKKDYENDVKDRFRLKLSCDGKASSLKSCDFHLPKPCGTKQYTIDGCSLKGKGA